MKKTNLLLAAVALLFLVSSTYATVTVVPHVIQAMEDATFKVTNSITLIDSRFLVALGSAVGTGTTSGTAALMTISQSIANTPVTDGDWELRIALVASPSTPSSTTFSVDLHFTGGMSPFSATLFVRTDTTPSGYEVECFRCWAISDYTIHPHCHRTVDPPISCTGLLSHFFLKPMAGRIRNCGRVYCPSAIPLQCSSSRRRWTASQAE